MLMKDERKQIVEYGKRMSLAGLTKGTAGNISAYDPQTGYMAISPSGIGYSETQPEDIVIMTLDGKVIEGERVPSSEYDLHATIYREKPDARAAVHTHSKYCTALACMRKPLKAVHYIIASAGVAEIPCTDYATFGTEELANNLKQVMGESRAALLANHGAIFCGPDMKRAFGLAVSCEYCAEIQLMCEYVGKDKAVVLNNEEISAVMERFSSYGQATEDKTCINGY